MNMLPAIGLALLLAFSALPVSLASQDGPPPEIRERIQAFTDALNSASAEQWEKMTAAHFSPTLLARIGRDERRQLFDSLRSDFGIVTVGRVLRDGPSAPLRLEVTGASGQRGVIELALEPAKPFRINGVGVDVGGAAEREQKGPPPPPITASMSNAELSKAFDKAMKAGMLLDAGRSKAFYAGRGIAGGAPGTSAVVISGPVWTVIVLTNLDPDTGESIGTAISRALRVE